MRTLTKVQTTTTDTKQDALAWLSSQLRWERTLGELRSHEDGAPVKQAA
jgi:hypothetical protein